VNESRTALIERSEVGAVTAYGEYRQSLRVDFWFSCAYCTMTECEGGGVRFTVDHYLPKSKRPELELVYDNLLYCCDRCNTYKGAFYEPLLESRGYRLYRPDWDVPEDHFEAKVERIEPISNIGEMTVEVLYLNRLGLRRVRDLRRRLYDSQRVVTSGLRALRSTPLDRLGPATKAQYLEVFDDVKDEVKDLGERVEKLIRELSRSPLLDEDPGARSRTKGRREYLQRIRALVPE